MKKNCFICNKVIVKQSKTSIKQWHTRKYCSVKCKSVDMGLKFKGNQSAVWVNIKREKICEYCGKEFLVKTPCEIMKTKYCSKKCFYNKRKGISSWNKGKIEWKKCLGCNVLVRKWRKYCSKKCQVGHLSPPVILEKNCVLCKKIFQVRLSQKTQICCSDICGKKIAGKTRSGVNHPMYGKHHTIEARKKISIGHIGILAKEKNPNWKGGKQTQNHMDRVRFRKTIQKQVLERDNYTCQLCGQIGGDLQVDHIQSWAEYIKMRFCIDNCRTLCVPCHYKITYGKPMPPSVRAWGHHFLKGGNL